MAPARSECLDRGRANRRRCGGRRHGKAPAGTSRL